VSGLGTGTDGRALVTGASSGIGEAFARALRARGRRLVLVARRADRLARLAQELGGEEAALAVPLDLTESGAPERLRAELLRRGISVDLLVNNAGVGHTGRFLEEPPERLGAMLDLNVRAVVELTRLFVKPMVAAGRGAVVNVVSTSAFQPVPYLGVYAASKAFVLSLTEALASELHGTGVTVQALCPGLTESEFHQTAGTDKVLFTRTAMMPARAVAEQSLRALERRRLVVVPGWQNRLVLGLQRFLPRAIVRAAAGRLFRPPPGSA
jgi:short-subunit dehydrogenase